jgi:hypothetical protein
VPKVLALVAANVPQVALSAALAPALWRRLRHARSECSLLSGNGCLANKEGLVARGC